MVVHQSALLLGSCIFGTARGFALVGEGVFERVSKDIEGLLDVHKLDPSEQNPYWLLVPAKAELDKVFIIARVAPIIDHGRRPGFWGAATAIDARTVSAIGFGSTVNSVNAMFDEASRSCIEGKTLDIDRARDLFSGGRRGGAQLSAISTEELLRIKLHARWADYVSVENLFFIVQRDQRFDKVLARGCMLSAGALDRDDGAITTDLLEKWLDHLYNSVEDRLRHLRREYEILEDERTSTQNTLRDTMRNLSTLQRQNDNLQSDIGKLGANITSQEQQLRTLGEEKGELEQRLSNLTHDYNATRRSLFDAERARDDAQKALQARASSRQRVAVNDAVGRLDIDEHGGALASNLDDVRRGSGTIQGDSVERRHNREPRQNSGHGVHADDKAVAISSAASAKGQSSPEHRAPRRLHLEKALTPALFLLLILMAVGIALPFLAWPPGGVRSGQPETQCTAGLFARFDSELREIADCRPPQATECRRGGFFGEGSGDCDTSQNLQCRGRLERFERTLSDIFRCDASLRPDRQVFDAAARQKFSVELTKAQLSSADFKGTLANLKRSVSDLQGRLKLFVK